DHPLKALLVTARGQRHAEAAAKAAPAGVDLAILHAPDREALRVALAEAEVLVSERSGAVDAELIAAAPRLRLIQRLGSLAHDIDLDAARAAAVPVCVWPLRLGGLAAE